MNINQKKLKVVLPENNETVIKIVDQDGRIVTKIEYDMQPEESIQKISDCVRFFGGIIENPLE